MAETFLFNIADKVLGKLGSLTLQEVCLACGVVSEQEKLNSTLSAIRAVLLDAEEKQATNRQITDWLRKIKDALYDADDVLDEFQYEALRTQVQDRGGITRKDEGIGCLNALRYLSVMKCNNLQFLGEGMQRLTAIRKLVIWRCESLEEFLLRCMRNLTALETLEIWDCGKLNLMESEEDIQGLTLCLRSLGIHTLPHLVVLPQWIQGAANTLQILRIQNCYNLVSLPEWLQNLTSLQKLWIINCPKLSALPNGMQCLTALTEMNIRGCPQLSKSCERETGEDWPKIAFVQEITFDYRQIKSIYI